MVLEDAQQAVTATSRMLAAVRDGAASTGELRKVLDATRSITAAATATQTAAAELIARRERHGDGGVEMLASSAGLPQHEARNQVVTAAALQKVPKLRDAVQSGDISQANARRLAAAITKTGAAAVAGDDTLLAQAESMRPEQFERTARRWINTHQADDGESEYLRQRARRYLRMHDTDDGMVSLRGEFDKITGTRIHNRLLHTARQLFNSDKTLPKAQRREFPQCMADALERCTTNTTRPASGGVDNRRNTDAATGTSTNCGNAAGCRCAQQPRNANTAAGTSTETASIRTSPSTNADADHCGVGDSEDSGGSDDAVGVDAADRDAGGGWVADITLIAHVDETTGELIAELSDGSKLPAAVLEELSCNARWTGLIYNHAGDAIWRSRSRRTVTDTQWQALLAKHGGCFHCGAPPRICQAHHITPYSKGGATSLNNLIMVCWNCHHKIHHHNWRIHKHPDGNHTLHPPNNPALQPRYGPACADYQPPTPEPPPRRERPPDRPEHKPDRTRNRARDPDPATLW
ncbi:MAG: DUF222 domain-containing protein [Acidimicrobiaceae bacterium]|nr:DUF222 domain-containing protein [Acidimicrobiaceae bacterium]